MFFYHNTKRLNAHTMSHYIDYTNNTNKVTNTLNGSNNTEFAQNDPRVHTNNYSKSSIKDPNSKSLTEKRVKINPLISEEKNVPLEYPKSPKIFQISNRNLNKINNSNNVGKMSNQRKPLNTNDDANIYDASVKNVSKENNFRQLQNENHSPVRNEQANNKSMNQPNNTTRTNGNSPSHGHTRIAKRELWWKEPPPSEVKMAQGGKFKPDNVTPRVDHQNLNYRPARESSKVIESRKLQWQKKAVTDTWSNFNHKPQG
jgi:hypothetical protein